MNKEKAQKKARRKISRLKPRPFCGKTPKVRASVDDTPNGRGSTGHYAVREGCCLVTGLGQTELFYCSGFVGANYRLWKGMVDRLVNDWNKRA